MNLGLALAQGQVRGVRLSAPRASRQGRRAARAPTHPEIVRDAERRLQIQLSARSRAAIEEALEEAPDLRHARQLALGLALGSPEFQRR
jgi:hypothetical protein